MPAEKKPNGFVHMARSMGMFFGWMLDTRYGCPQALSVFHEF
jgi:hypothetical protein